MNEQREINFTCDICGEGCERFPVGGLLETVSMTTPIETCIHPDPTLIGPGNHRQQVPYDPLWAKLITPRSR